VKAKSAEIKDKATEKVVEKAKAKEGIKAVKDAS